MNRRVKRIVLAVFVGLNMVLGGVGAGAVHSGQAQRVRESIRHMEKLPYTLDGGGPSYRVVSLEFDGPFPKLPTMMMVYRVKEPNVTEGYARGLAQKHFNMPQQAELMRSDGMGLYWLKSPTHIVEVQPLTGFFSMRKAGKWYSKRKGQHSWPSREECEIIASQYIERQGLLEKDAYLRSVVDNTSGAGVMSVGFGRLIGGFKSWGAGTRIGVHISCDGEVVSVRKAWQELVPYKPYLVKMPGQALDELRNRKGVLMHGSRGKVEEITFRYYTSSDKQEYVQPIYYFDCNGPQGRFYGVVPAIKDEYLEPPEDTSPPTWMICRNTECQAEYEIKLKEYVAAVAEFVKAHPNSPLPPSLVCEKCGKDSAYRAIKCEKCGLVFEAGWKGPDYYDRCPQCKFSKTEERKRRTKPKRKG